VCGRWVDRCNARAQLAPRHDSIHLGEELGPSRHLRVLLESGAGQRRLRTSHRHLPFSCEAARRMTAQLARERGTYSEIPFSLETEGEGFSVTLILTCATRRSIVQVSDRRLTVDGRLYDDNPTKAVFYCGRVAIAYTGDARIAGQDTAGGLSGKLTGHANLEEALGDVARSFEELLARRRGRRPSLAVVASGWAT